MFNVRGIRETDDGNGAKRKIEERTGAKDVALPLIFCRESDII